MSAMIPNLDKATTEANLAFTDLIPALRAAFAAGEAVVPMRHHHDYANPPETRESTLLLMPAWRPGEDLGVKLVTVSPCNGRYGLPAIQGVYLLFDARKGHCRAVLDAKSLTALRTAATSALASSFLSRPESSRLLVVGTGALAAMLARAHASVRPISSVRVWGRDAAKAQAVCDLLAPHGLLAEPAASIEEGMAEADIVSCATLSPSPLVEGRWLRPGQHLDLVGSYRPDMREADDDCVRRARIFVDHYAGAVKETGDIVIPMARGVISRGDLLADLFELCAGAKPGRGSPREITLFKSVGHALEDLVAASLVAARVL